MQSRTLRVRAVASFASIALLGCIPDAAADRRDASPAAEAAPDVGAAPSAERSARRVVLGGVDLTGIGYDKGSADAPIVIVDFSDFGCGYCRGHAQQTVPELEHEFIATGKVFYKYVPFVLGIFPNGDLAARASECAGDQEKFWAMHDLLYATQREWKRGMSSKARFRGYAAALEIDKDTFASCLADGRTDARTARADRAAARLGVRSTPTFFVDGELVRGALPLDVFQAVLRNKLSR